jgi:GDP-D-mannose dehydratase
MLKIPKAWWLFFNYQTNNGQRKTPEIGKEILAVDPTFRPTEVDLLIGDPAKAQN